MRTKIDLGGVSPQFGRYSITVDVSQPERPYPYELTMTRQLPSGDIEELTCWLGPQTMQELIRGLTVALRGTSE